MITAKPVSALMKVSDLLCEEASDIGQGAPRHDMASFLIECADKIRRAVSELVVDPSAADEKGASNAQSD